MSGRIGFTVRNLNTDRPGGQALVYAGERNSLSFELRNNTGKALQLTPLDKGEDVSDEDDLLEQGATTAVYFTLSGFGAEPATLSLSAPRGWKTRAFRNGWGASPTDPSTLEARGTITFRIEGLQVAGAAHGQASVGADYFNLGDETGFATPASVLVQSRGTGQRKERVFQLFELAPKEDGRDRAVVHLSEDGLDPIENTLIVVLGNATETGDGDVDCSATFSLSFHFADDEADALTAHALTTKNCASGAANEGKPITVTCDNPDWTPVPPDFNEPRPVWTIRPPRLLGADETVVFTIRDIRIPHGEKSRPSFAADKTTNLFLQWADVDGYDPGFVGLPYPIWKKRAASSLDSFLAEPTEVDVGGQVSFSWTTTAVDYVTLNGVKVQTSAGQPIRNTNHYPVTPTRSGDYLLKAYRSGRVVGERPLPIVVHQKAPKIVRFAGTPRVIPRSERKVVLSWEVENWSIDDEDSQLYIDGVGRVASERSRSLTVDGPVRYVLTARNAGGRDRATFDLLAYTCHVVRVPIGSNPVAVHLAGSAVVRREGRIIVQDDEGEHPQQVFGPPSSLDRDGSGLYVLDGAGRAIYIVDPDSCSLRAMIPLPTKVYEASRFCVTQMRSNQSEYLLGIVPGEDSFRRREDGWRWDPDSNDFVAVGPRYGRHLPLPAIAPPVYLSSNEDEVGQAVCTRPGNMRAYRVYPGFAEIIEYSVSAPEN